MAVRYLLDTNICIYIAKEPFKNNRYTRRSGERSVTRQDREDCTACI